MASVLIASNKEILLGDGDGSGAETETATVATLSNVVFEGSRANQIASTDMESTQEQAERTAVLHNRLSRVSRIQFQINQISHDEEKPQITGSTTANVGTRSPGTLFPLSALPIFKLSLMGSCNFPMKTS